MGLPPPPPPRVTTLAQLARAVCAARVDGLRMLRRRPQSCNDPVLMRGCAASLRESRQHTCECRHVQPDHDALLSSVARLGSQSCACGKPRHLHRHMVRTCTWCAHVVGSDEQTERYTKRVGYNQLPQPPHAPASSPQHGLGTRKGTRGAAGRPQAWRGGWPNTHTGARAHTQRKGFQRLFTTNAPTVARCGAPWAEQNPHTSLVHGAPQTCQSVLKPRRETAQRCSIASPRLFTAHTGCACGIWHACVSRQQRCWCVCGRTATVHVCV
jgi:hypothetical protein